MMAPADVPREPAGLDLQLELFARILQRDGPIVAALAFPRRACDRLLDACLRRLPRDVVLRRLEAELARREQDGA
jgi:hypothetical protein